MTTGRSPRLEWLPPLLIGASAAVVAEVAMSLLLYGGVGFVRSLTTVLAVEGFALAGGLWSAPGPGPDLIDRLRRRWLVSLFAFFGAVLFGTVWSLYPQLSEWGLGQGAGLALLAALPLYTVGVVLGGMSLVAASDPGGRLAAPGAAAAAGAGLGFVLTGFLLPRTPVPASLLVACLVMLSLAGMIYGGVLSARTRLDVRAERPGRGLDVRVEERRTGIDGVEVLELREGPFVRRSVGLGKRDKDFPWDVAVVQALLPRPDAPSGEARPDDSSHVSPDAPSSPRVLLVGGGASSAARAVREHPTGFVDVLERTGAVVELGREHFDTELTIGRDDRTTVTAGNLDDAIIACDGPYDVVLVDALALAPIGGIAGLSTMARRRLTALVRPGGVLVWGPDLSNIVLPEAERWNAKRYHRPVRYPLESESESVVLLRRDDGAPWHPVLGGFKQMPDP